MRAVNAMDSFDSSKHSGVIAHFNQCHVKTGHFDSSVSSVIRRASRLRERSDYEDFYEPDKDDAERTIEEVSLFIATVSEYLSTTIETESGDAVATENLTRVVEDNEGHIEADE